LIKGEFIELIALCFGKKNSSSFMEVVDLNSVTVK